MAEEIVKCELCDKIFHSKEALEMHNNAKHGERPLKKDPTSSPKNYKKARNWIIFIVVFGLIVWGFYSLMTAPNAFDTLPVTEINIGSHQNIALHIHSELEIKIDGKEIPIPSDIGLLPGIMRPLHTHDSSGEIHIEGPYARDFTIGEFFQIWNKTFNSTCIFENCIGEGSNATLKMTVNGQENNQFENYILRDDDKISIEYSSLG